MFEPEIGRLRRSGNRLLRRNLGDKHSDPAELEVEARPAVRLHRADDLSPEHLLVPPRRGFHIGAAQVNVVIGESSHAFLPLPIGQPATLGAAWHKHQPDQMPRTVGRLRSRQAWWLSLASSVADKAMNR